MLFKKLMPKKALLINAELTRFIKNSHVLKKSQQKAVEHSATLLAIAQRIMPTKVENYFVLHQVKRLSQPFMDEGEIDFLDNKIVLVELSDLKSRWYFTKIGQQLVMLEKNKALTMASEADVVFSASLDALVLMASQKVDPDTLFFNRKLKITGDSELGLEIKNLFDQFDLEILDKPFKKILDIWSNDLIQSQ